MDLWSDPPEHSEEVEIVDVEQIVRKINEQCATPGITNPGDEMDLPTLLTPGMARRIPRELMGLFADDTTGSEFATVVERKNQKRQATKSKDDEDDEAEDQGTHAEDEDDDDKPITVAKKVVAYTAKRIKRPPLTIANPFDMIPFALLLNAAKRGFHGTERKAVRRLATVPPEEYSNGLEQSKLEHLDSRWTHCICGDEHSWRWRGHSNEPTTECERCNQSARIACKVCRSALHMVCVGLSQNLDPEMQPYSYTCSRCRVPDSELSADNLDIVFERCLLEPDMLDVMELSSQNASQLCPELDKNPNQPCDFLLTDFAGNTWKLGVRPSELRATYFVTGWQKVLNFWAPRLGDIFAVVEVVGGHMMRFRVGAGPGSSIVVKKVEPNAPEVISPTAAAALPSVLCLCGKPRKGFYVQCAGGSGAPCGGWVHPECAGVTPARASSLRAFKCELCRKVPLPEPASLSKGLPEPIPQAVKIQKPAITVHTVSERQAALEHRNKELQHRVTELEAELIVANQKCANLQLEGELTTKPIKQELALPVPEPTWPVWVRLTEDNLEGKMIYHPVFVRDSVTQKDLCSLVGAKLNLGADAQFAVLVEAVEARDHIILGDDEDVRELLKPEMKLLVIGDL